jgi:hypothetical protein
MYSLSMGEGFNQPVDRLPPRLRQLVVGSGLTYPMHNLPDTITHLVLDGEWNCANVTFPSALQHFMDCTLSTLDI